MNKKLLTASGKFRCLSCGEPATVKITIHDSEFNSCEDCVDIVRNNYLSFLFTGKETGLISNFRGNAKFRKKKNLIRDNKIRSVKRKS